MLTRIFTKSAPQPRYMLIDRSCVDRDLIGLITPHLFKQLITRPRSAVRDESAQHLKLLKAHVNHFPVGENLEAILVDP